MINLGVDVASILPWFQREQELPYVLIRVSAEHTMDWDAVLGLALRRCYIADDALKQHVQAQIFTIAWRLLQDSDRWLPTLGSLVIDHTIEDLDRMIPAS